MAHYSDLQPGDPSADYAGYRDTFAPLPPGLYRRYFKRGLDGLSVLLAAPIVLPLILILGLLIRRDGGPVFFCQDRVGRHGRVFRLWKLRSMQVDAERRLEAHLAADPAARAEWDETQKLKVDPRITPIGRLLRKTSLDELPQLWNVFRGDMSLVGPRPLITEEDALFSGWERRRYHVAPGITGPWQILGSSRVPLSEMVKIDYLYCANWSLWLDAKTLARTVPYVLSRRSPEHLPRPH
jgi:exopolysaccharide production protein ExoY